MRRQLAAVLVALLVFPPLVAAQTLTPGTRVRFSHPGEGTRTGTVVAYSTDTLEVQLPERSGVTHLPLDEVTRLEVSLGKQRHMKDAPTGLVAGALFGAIAGFAAGTDDCSRELVCFDRKGTAALGAIFFGGLGGTIGLLKGAIPTESWERVAFERRRVSFIAPSVAQGHALGLRVAF
jgi:hypothetical protein